MESPAMNKQADAIQSIDDFLTSVNAQGEKQGEANTEAGGYEGGTTHPVKDVDDRTENADTGFRHAENASDNKAEPNRGDATVDNTAEASTSTQSGNMDQDSVQYNIGTQQAATGEEPSVETGSAKSTKEDDGYQGASSHPARTDNDALDGHKYANAEGMSLEELAASIQKVGNDLVAGITADSMPKGASEGGGQSKDPKSQPHADTPPGKGKKKEAGEGTQENKEAMDAPTAANAGAELASLLNSDGSINQGFDKQSADYMVQEFLYETVKTASEDADNVINFAQQHAAAKEAMGPEEMMSGGEQPMEAAMHEEPGEAGGPEGGEEEMLAALAGGGEGGEGPPMMGGEEMMGGGEMMGGPEEGGEGQELALLQQILAELEAEQPGAAKEVEAALKTAAAKQSGDKKAEMKAMLKELIGRSTPAA
jgi:hypothetical protein